MSNILAQAIHENLEPVPVNIIEQFLLSSVKINPIPTVVILASMYVTREIEEIIETARDYLELESNEYAIRFLTQFLDYVGE